MEGVKREGGAKGFTRPVLRGGGAQKVLDSQLSHPPSPQLLMTSPLDQSLMGAYYVETH